MVLTIVFTVTAPALFGVPKPKTGISKKKVLTWTRSKNKQGSQN